MLSFSAVVLSLALSAFAGVATHRRGEGRLVTSCTKPNTAALTFDDGPFNYQTEIVDILKANDAKGTFFVNGKNYGCIYDESNVRSLQYAFDNGMQIASHTWGHRDLKTLSTDELRSEMSRTNGKPHCFYSLLFHNSLMFSIDAICRIVGERPAFMRPPYGNYNDDVLSVAGEFSQTAVTWNMDSGDSLGADIPSQKQACDSIISQHPDGIISLQHEIYDSSVHDVLPYYIQQLKGAGYSLVTVAECLGEPAYLVGACTEKGGYGNC